VDRPGCVPVSEHLLLERQEIRTADLIQALVSERWQQTRHKSAAVATRDTALVALIALGENRAVQDARDEDVERVVFEQRDLDHRHVQRTRLQSAFEVSALAAGLVLVPRPRPLDHAAVLLVRDPCAMARGAVATLVLPPAAFRLMTTFDRATPAAILGSDLSGKILGKRNCTPSGTPIQPRKAHEHWGFAKKW
jgi:hypothetical protein